jgi:putative nucleotidyltransferase with HDIG domain
MQRELKKIELPSVPHVALKLFNLLNIPNINLQEIEEVILSDQALTAKILKIANSAFYGLRRQIQLVNEAINVLGFKTLKDIVIIASIRDVYKVFGLIEKKIWEHGVGVSFASGILTDFVPIVKKDEANLAGLLHDVGKIIINNNFPQEYANCMNIVNQNKINFLEVERELFGFDHAEVGGMLAEKWGFADELKTVILNHHNLEYIKKCEDLHEKSLLLIVALADSICTRLGVGYKDSMPELIKDEPKIMSMLGLTERDYSNVVNLFIDSFANYLDSFMD